MRRFVALALVAAPIAFAAPAGAATIEFGGSRGFVYAPDSLRVRPGDPVTWTGDFGIHPLHSAKASEPFTKTGTIGVTTSFDHTFAAAGLYRYYCGMHGMTSADNQVSGMSGEVVVTYNTPPTAAFIQSATQVPSGTQVTFDGGSSQDAEGPVTYAWDLDGDGAYDDGTGPTASRVYTSPDGESTTVSVGLRVSDDNADFLGPERSVVHHDLTVVGGQGTTTPPPSGGGTVPGGGTTPGGDGSGTTTPDTRAPVLSLLGRKLLVRSRRIAVRLSADEPGRVTITLRTGRTVLAKGAGPVATTARTFRLKLTAAGRKRLRHGRRVKATLRVMVRDAAGNARTLKRAVTIRA
jgi:plastocyanin